MRRLALGALFVLSACTSILGDDFEILPAPATGGGGTATVASGTGAGTTTVGTGGMGGSSSSAATAAGGASQGGAGGAGGSGGSGGSGGCVLGTDQGCGNAQKCSVSNIATGEIGCVSAGPRVAYSQCTIDGQCEVGTWCDLVRGVCKPICAMNGDCNGGNCIPARSGGNDIPGLTICTADCNPLTSQPCSQSQGDTKCTRTTDGLDCAPAGSKTKYTTCLSDLSCTIGLVCHEGFCYSWCDDVGGGCPGNGFCNAVDPVAIGSNATEYGWCDDFN